MKRVSLVVALLGAVVLAVAGIASAGAPAGTTTQVGQCAFSTSNSTWTLNSDCTTSTTIVVPNGVTLNGNGHTITAVDPTPGVFTGAVVANGGAAMNVQNLAISGSSNAVDVCRDFNGVAFLAASGSISNVTLTSIGLPETGCQQGRAILVDAIGSAIQQSVKIENNTVKDYNKNGIDVRGNVAAKIDGNNVTTQASDKIIRNGIVVRTGASAQVWGNTVSGNSSTAYPSSATGLLVVDGASVNLTKQNALTGNDVPMDIEGSTVVGSYKVSA
jgi:hypothetical protein